MRCAVRCAVRTTGGPVQGASVRSSLPIQLRAARSGRFNDAPMNDTAISGAAAPLITPRLTLQPITVAEAARIVEDEPAAGDRWADGFPTEDDQDGVRGFLKNAETLGDCGPFGNYRVEVRRDAVTIGTIGFYGPPDPQRRVTVGYGLVPHSWGHGYATEAVAALVALCRAHPGVAEMLADTEPANTASQRVLAKNGFTLQRSDPKLNFYALAVG